MSPDVSKPKATNPILISKHCWVYGEKEGLCVVQEYRDENGEYVDTVIVTVPWSKIDEAKGK
jgi:hypothetical protein